MYRQTLPILNHDTCNWRGRIRAKKLTIFNEEMQHLLHLLAYNRVRNAIHRGRIMKKRNNKNDGIVYERIRRLANF